MILVEGDRATLDDFQHEAEAYRFDAGFHLEREEILDGQQAKLVIRPTLRLGGAVLPIGLLEKVRLTVSATDLDGVASSQTTADFRLEENGETVHQFKVPPRVRELAVRIDASVPSVSAGEDVDLSDAEAFNVNEVATTAGLILPHVTRGGQEYVLEVRGRNGEMRRGELVSVQLHHRDVKTPITFSLQSDEQGRILLGRLAEIATINVRMADGLQLNWTLDESTYSYLPVLTGVAGEPILVPWMRPSEEPIREELGLLELRDGKPVVDRFEQIQIHAGCLTLRDLAAGDYLLLLKRDGRRIHVDVSEGAVQDGQILGDLRLSGTHQPAAYGVALAGGQRGEGPHSYAARRAEYAYSRLRKPIHGSVQRLEQPARTGTAGGGHRHAADGGFVVRCRTRYRGRVPLHSRPAVDATLSGQYACPAGLAAESVGRA